MKKLLKEVIPRLSPNRHKGQDGRLCVVGGSLEYTGAAFFAGRSILRCGGDLAHIVCDKQAAIPIKSYCPELMVAPYLNCLEPSISTDLQLWMEQTLKRMDAIVIGPGLGRHENTMHATSKIIRAALQHKVPLVIDGDGLWLLALTQYRGVLQSGGNDSQHNIVLTPNAMEFRRLWINHVLKKDVNAKAAVAQSNVDEYMPPFDTADLYEKLTTVSEEKNDNDDSDKKLYTQLRCDEIFAVKDFTGIQHIKDTATLAQTMGGVTVFRKGAVDIVCNGEKFILISKPCSLRRCGGQGDILAGVIGLWLHWCRVYEAKNQSKETEHFTSTITASFAGSYLMRSFASAAFEKFQRSTLTSDMIECIPVVLQREFPILSSL